MFSKLFLLLAGCSVTLAVDISTDVNEMKFFFYPTAADKRDIIFENAATLQPLQSGVPTIILIDGFMSDSTSPMSQHTKNSALSKSSGQNIIVVDWGRLSGAGLSLGNLIETAAAYSTVLKNVGPCGSRIADFISFLGTKGIRSSDIHIIGHSLGAHIAGAAGTFFQQRYGSTLHMITGLDPAGPFFSLQVDSDKRLHSGDADFVQIYHTNRGTLGDSEHQTGDINVYVNGGDNQPGCEQADSDGFAGYCSHSYSWKFYDASYHREIKACPCTGLPCQCKSNCNVECANPIVLGPNVPQTARGAYHLIITDSLAQYA